MPEWIIITETTLVTKWRVEADNNIEAIENYDANGLILEETYKNEHVVDYHIVPQYD